MRGKIGKSILMLSLIVASIMAFAIAPVSAQVTTMSAPSIVNPLFDEGTVFNMDIQIEDVSELMTYEFTLSYDTNILTCTNYLFTMALGFADFLPGHGINDAAGYMQMGATTGDPLVNVTTDYPLPIATITFVVDARGTCALALSDTELIDATGSLITHTAADGWFDNTIQGILSAPTVIDSTLTAGSTFDIEITAAEVEMLWGYQFILQYNEAVLTCMRAESLSIFTDGFWSRGPGYVAMAYSSYFGDPEGLTTEQPVPVAKITFRVDTGGISTLDLTGTTLVNVYGDTLYHETYDGWFSNSWVALDTGFVESRRFKLSKDPEGIQTLTAQIKAEGAGSFEVAMHFDVYDAEGALLDSLLAEGAISGGETMRLSADLDVSGLLYQGLSVEIWGEFGAFGEWALMHKGAMTAAKTSLEMTFTVQP